MAELIEGPDDLVVRGDEYELSHRNERPGHLELSVRGERVASLPLTCCCHTTTRRDSPGRCGPLSAGRSSEGLLLTASSRGGAWPERLMGFLCRPEGIDLQITLRGARGDITDLEFFSGGHGREGAAPGFDRIFNPEPNVDGVQFLAAHEDAEIGLRNDTSFHRGNWFFSPGPFYYGLLSGNRALLGIAIAAPSGENNFTAFAYRGFGGPTFALRYEGGVRVDGEWQSPRLTLRPITDAYEGLASVCAWLRRSGYAPTPSVVAPDWWREPIFCGWGEQVNQTRQARDIGEACRAAATLATQANYERFLRCLERRGLHPGTVIIDDKWQATYGAPRIDEQKWPDLPGFIRGQHGKGRRVLLWLKAWDGEGLPPAERLRTTGSEQAWASVAEPAYARRLQETVRHLLRDCDADGFKVDFTHRAPPAEAFATVGGPRGLELLKTLLSTLHDASREVKPDALLIAHACHPYFADVVDMLRLNDIGTDGNAASYVAAMAHRARVARSVWPGWLIDTDNWPSPSRATWREYLLAQPSLGVPALYYASGIRYLNDERVLCDEAFTDADYQAIAATWGTYRAATDAGQGRVDGDARPAGVGPGAARAQNDGGKP